MFGLLFQLRRAQRRRSVLEAFHSRLYCLSEGRAGRGNALRSLVRGWKHRLLSLDGDSRFRAALFRTCLGPTAVTVWRLHPNLGSYSHILGTDGRAVKAVDSSFPETSVQHARVLLLEQSAWVRIPLCSILFWCLPFCCRYSSSGNSPSSPHPHLRHCRF